MRVRTSIARLHSSFDGLTRAAAGNGWSGSASKGPAAALPSLVLAAILGVSGLSEPLVVPAVHAAAPAPAVSAGATALTPAQIDRYISAIPVVAIVNEDNQPFFTSSDRGVQVGYFYLDPVDALRDMKLVQQQHPEAKLQVTTLSDVYFKVVLGDRKELGGAFRVRPSRRQVINANRALQFNSPEGTLIPVTLDEGKGQVPMFYSERVVLSIDQRDRYPFFFRKEDLDAAFVQMTSGEGPSAEATPEGGGSGGSRRQRSVAEPMGLPVGLVRVATLDGIVKQMQSGEVDLSAALFVGSPEAAALSKQLVAQGGGGGSAQDSPAQ